MKTIIRGRDSGKAKELLEYARENNALVVTENKRAFQVKANSLGYKDVTIVDYEDLSNTDFTNEFSSIVIHNADKWLEEVFANSFYLKVIGFSATEE